MKALTAIGVIMLTLGFLSSILDASPIGHIMASSPDIDESTPFSLEIVEDTASKAGALYTGQIDEMMAFLDNPDLATAEARRDEMMAYAKTLADGLEGFALALQGNFDGLVADTATGEG